MAVTTLRVARREPVLDGRPFGDAGAYEKIAGTLHFAVDPTHPLHAEITDLGRAPRNGAGLVEFSADFYLLRPRDVERGNGAVLLDVPNRGRKVALGMFNSTPRAADPTTAEDFGNGFLMRHGYTVAWVGWQPDVPREDGLMVLDAPVARGVTGLVRCEFRPNLPVRQLPMADRYHIPQATVALDDPQARLTVREHAGAERVTVPRATWRFCDPTHVELDGGFVPGRLYELIYRAQDPAIVGLGLLAVRDVGAWLRFGSAADGHPCAGTLRRAYAFGVSQSGRFLRHFLYLALNQDERGRRVFDAVVPHVAGARRGEFNMRFGQPSLNAKEAVGSLFPFTDVEQTDPVSGARGSLLARQAARGGLPRIFTINSSAEYWRGDGSLVHTDVQGHADVDTVPEARVYLLAGTQHTPGALPPPDADPNTGGRGRQTFNLVDYAPLLRAALVNLDVWVREGIAPPPSRYPRLQDGNLVRPTDVAFPDLPGVTSPRKVLPGARGVNNLIAKDGGAGALLPLLVSQIDRDGNELAGLRLPDVMVPLATTAGWNFRKAAIGGTQLLYPLLGSYIPFASTKAERERTHDPRPSIEERYPSRDQYLKQVQEAAASLVKDGYVLAEDVPAIVKHAGDHWDLLVKRPSGTSTRAER